MESIVMTTSDYIDIPFVDRGRSLSGCDCWGLIRLFYKNELGIDLPVLSNDYQDTEDSDAIEQIITGQKIRWTPVTDPRQGDVVVLRIAGKESHVGIYLEGNRMLHVIKGANSCVESLKSSVWKNRIAGIYRYE